MLGECRERIVFSSFSLPEVASTRFISLVSCRVHSYNGNESVNVDVMKFIPYGEIVPVL